MTDVGNSITEWRESVTEKVNQMHEDLRHIKAALPKLEKLEVLPDKFDRAVIAIDKLADAMLGAVIGAEHIPVKTHEKIVDSLSDTQRKVIYTLCFIIGAQGVAFVGAQGWFKGLLPLLGIL
jgi:hypothetical protein